MARIEAMIGEVDATRKSGKLPIDIPPTTSVNTCASQIGRKVGKETRHVARHIRSP